MAEINPLGDSFQPRRCGALEECCGEDPVAVSGGEGDAARTFSGPAGIRTCVQTSVVRLCELPMAEFQRRPPGHAFLHDMPFGGSGHSGVGSYPGRQIQRLALRLCLGKNGPCCDDCRSGGHSERCWRIWAAACSIRASSALLGVMADACSSSSRAASWPSSSYTFSLARAYS